MCWSVWGGVRGKVWGCREGKGRWGVKKCGGQEWESA